MSRIIVPQPVPTATVDLLGRTGDPVLVLTNTSLFRRNIMIGATINGNNGISGKVDPRGKRPRAPITLERGATITLSGDDLLNIFSNYTVFDIDLSGINIRSLIQNQLFPEGTYRLCAQVYDYQTGEQLSAPGSGCTGPLTVRTPDPPIIIMPQERETLLGGEWQNIIFRWTPVNLSTTIPLYRIRIAEVPSGVNPYDAIDNDNLIRWVEEDLFKTSFLYDISLPKLPKGRYAVQVTAYDADGQMAIKNEGRSDVVSFNIADQQPQPPRLVIPLNSDAVAQTDPQSYLFTWVGPSGVQVPLRYRFRMVDIPSLSYARDFIDNPSALIYSTETRSPRLTFKELDPVLKVGNAYAWQVQVFDPAGEVTFENDGYSDVFAFTVKEAKQPAPEIMSPAQDEIIAAAWPFSLSIDWKHELTQEVPVAYQVGIWPFRDGDNPNRVIRDVAPIILEEEVAITTFSTSNTVLADGGKFLVRVVATSEDSDVAFLNFGRSNLRIFEIEKTVTNHVLELACGEGCRYELPANTQAVGAFEQGDTVRMGNFLLRLTEGTTESNSFYRGNAEILPGSFFKAPVLVNLNNVRFNEAGIAVSGFAEAMPPENLTIPQAWKGNIGALRLPEDPERTSRSLATNSRSVSAESQSARSLPLEFSGVYLTYLKLLPTTATANLVNIQAFSGDRVQGEQYGLFAKRGICFSAGGPAIGEEEAYLPLINDVNIDRSSAFSITLLRNASDAPYGGTALPYSCEDTPVEVHMAGYVSIRQEGFSQDGQPLSTNPLYASFRATYQNWLDWQADLHLRPSGSRASCCNDFMTASLTYEELPDYQLEIEKLVLDHSGYSNPEGLQLPVGSNGPDAALLENFPGLISIWNGIYLKEASWQLPEFAKKANGERIAFPANNSVLDDAGFSSQSAFSTDEFGPEVVLKDWTARVLGSQVDVRANELEETTLGLDVRIPIFEANVPITGEAAWDGRNPQWTFSMPEIEGLERPIPAWSANLRLSRYRSSLAAAVSASREDLILTLALSGVLDFDAEIDDIGGIRLENIDLRNLYVNNWNTAYNQRFPIWVGAFKTSPNQLYKIGGYRIFIDELKVRSFAGDDMTSDGSKLILDYHFNFDALASMGQSGMSGEGQLNIFAVSDGTPVNRIRRQRSWLKPVEVEWSPMEGIEADGLVSYQQTPDGRMFKGNFNLKVLGYDARVSAHLGATHGTPFWALAGEVPFPRPIPVFLGLSTHAFGGGIYYNMIKPASPANGASVTEVNFIPPPAGRNPGNYGIMFSTVLLDEASNGSAFNGRFLLELDMRRQGLEQIRLSGVSHLLDESIPTDYWLNHTAPDPDGAFSIDASIRFNWPQRTFEALAGYRINFEDGLVTGEGQDVVDILVDPNHWHIYLGQPGNRLNAQLNMLDDPIELDAYFTLEGRTDDWSSAFESLQLGFRGSYETSTRAYRVPVTVADEIKFNGDVSFDLEGGFGYNTTFCSNHPAGEFFAYLSAAATVGFSVEYYESDESIWPWRVVNSRWNDWEEFTSWRISGNMAMYTPNPTGINLGLTVDIPYWGNENFSLQFGTRCQ